MAEKLISGSARDSLLFFETASEGLVIVSKHKILYTLLQLYLFFRQLLYSYEMRIGSMRIIPPHLSMMVTLMCCQVNTAYTLTTTHSSSLDSYSIP